MAPKSERTRSQSPISDTGTEDVDNTIGTAFTADGAVQTEPGREVNPFASLSSSSTSSSIGRAVSTDEAATVDQNIPEASRQHESTATTYRPTGPVFGADPFTLSGPSLGESTNIGTAFSTDEHRPIQSANVLVGPFARGLNDNPFRSSNSSSEDSPDSSGPAETTEGTAGLGQEVNPFTFSSFSMENSSNRPGRAISTDEPPSPAPGQASNVARPPSLLQRRLASQQNMNTAPVPTLGGSFNAATMRGRRRSSTVDPFGSVPSTNTDEPYAGRTSHDSEASDSSRMHMAPVSTLGGSFNAATMRGRRRSSAVDPFGSVAAMNTDEQYVGRTSHDSEPSASGTPSRRRSSDIDPQALAGAHTGSSTSRGRPIAQYPRTRGRVRSSASTGAGAEGSVGATSSHDPSPTQSARQSWNRRRSSTVDPFAINEAATDTSVPPSPVLAQNSGIWNRRRSSTIDPFASNEPITRTSSLIPPSVARSHISRVSAPNMPTPISEEPNPMEQAFGSVRFNPEATTDSANSGESSTRPGLGQGRRQSSSAAAGATGDRRGSFSGMFTRRFSRRESQIDPMDSTQRAASTGAIPTLATSQTSRPGGAQRSQSIAGEPSFTHPFQKGEGKLASARRASDSMQRRPSTLQRAMSMSGLAESPIPPRYRSRSVSSMAFFVTPMKRNNSVNPIFEEDIVAEKENVLEFLQAAKEVQDRDTRSKWQKEFFRAAYFFFLIALVYFVFVGRPLWSGLGSVYYGFMKDDATSRTGVVAVFIGWAALQGCLPLIFAGFEQEVDDVESRDASQTALIIPAYKAANVLPETIIAALKIFKKEQIYVMANGNAPEPMDNTADVCKEYGVNHAWVPIGSKITAEFVGVALTHKYKYIMLIDDDVHLPPNLPLVTHRITEQTKCIGYTIKSTGANGARGTLIQQCQDMEYKASGLGRTFSGKFGSSTFPHGAIILWERECLQNLFNVHPGFVISEDWYFGHCARASGCRIQFCSQVFVETETPPALFKSSSAARGGFGEMTVYKQRFYRWNYFFVHRIYDDGAYLLLSWRLGWLEIVTKFYVMIELYDSAMAILRPWIVVLTLISAAKLFFIMMAALLFMYCCIFTWFNAWHLRKKNEMVQWRILPVYLGMKFVLLWVTCASVYYSMYHYAIYFMAKHPRVIESTQALEAAYNVRLGTALVPLDTPAVDTPVVEVKEVRSSSNDTVQTDSESVLKKAY